MSATLASPASTTESAVNQARLIAPFLVSTKTVLSTMANVSATVGPVNLKNDTGVAHDVSAIIGFSGGVVGSMVIGLNKLVALRIVAAFSGSEQPIDSPDFADAIGELANMIAGSAKKDMGVVASISVPTVVIGPAHHTMRLSGIPCVVIPCKTPLGDFEVEVNIKAA